MEVPIAGHIVGSIEVYMAVTQLVEHVAQYFEESGIAHVVGNLAFVLPVHGIPIETILFGLVVEEAVLLIDDVP
jgi:hypothetical protein